MTAHMELDKYVQRKFKRGRSFFYFRVVFDGREMRRALPHPFDDGYRRAYEKAHIDLLGEPPNAREDPYGFRALIREHKERADYKDLAPGSKTMRDLACELVLERWGAFRPNMIEPHHAQALYDSLDERPATANRRLDDISALFQWGARRGYCKFNPCYRLKRKKSKGSYEPWPDTALGKLFQDGQRHILEVALAAIYTGQRRGDLLRRLAPGRIRAGIWDAKQSKTDNDPPIPLHPVVLALADRVVAARGGWSAADPDRPILENSQGNPWTPSGFGASWRKELKRLELNDHEPRLVFHGLRTTNATMIASAVAQTPELYGGREHVKAMLGHLSDRMAAHYARRAEVEHLNAESILLLPDFGNQSADWEPVPDTASVST